MKRYRIQRASQSARPDLERVVVHEGGQAIVGNVQPAANRSGWPWSGNRHPARLPDRARKGQTPATKCGGLIGLRAIRGLIALRWVI